MAEFSGIDDHGDICRVCRSEGSVDKPLFYPCVCTGSIKYIHQDCLVQWLKYSKKEFCELCNHKFSFRPIYSADMPKRLPLQDIISGLLKSVGRALKYWLHYTLVALAWLGLVPLVACRICRSLFTGSVSSLLTLPSDMISSSNIVTDIINGGFVVICSLCVFISLVWLREQLVHGGVPAWIQNDDQPAHPAAPPFAGRAADGGAALQMQDMPLDVMDEMDPDDELDLADDEDDEEWHDEMGDEVGAGDNQGVDGDAAAQQAAQQINQANWNPIGWERAPEELTWERLLGLDGSLVFLEHVFWVISLNTLFVLVFAFCPYHIGQWTVSGLRLSKYAEASKFEGVLTTMVGYVVVAMCLMILYTIMALTRLHKVRVFVGLSYIVVKVTILIVGEIGLFPLVCGWWLDLCSLPMFNATIHTRGESFNKAPGTAMFVHWLIGMVYVFYFASFILLLREIFRPGVLWFLRNVNDPEFNPIQEMVHIGVYRHSRRFILSMLIFGSTVMLMLWLPIRFIKYMFPGFLPYHVALSNDAPISELSLELLLLQVVLPSLLDQGHTRTWFKSLVVCWTRCVANLLNLNSYLLGNEDLEDKENIIRVDNDPVRVGVPAAPGNPGGPVGEAHQALLNMHGSSGFKPYYRPKYFHLRVFILLMLMFISLFTASVISLILPVFIGRKLMEIWMPKTKVHELYTAASGLYVCWLALRSIVILSSWVTLGWSSLMTKFKKWAVIWAKVVVVTFLLVGVVPLLIGLLFEQIVVVPLRVPLHQSPVFFPWQDWALGVLHTKILCGLTMIGPQWWLRRYVERLYENGVWNLNLKEVLTNLCLPVILVLSLNLAVPYVIAMSLAPLCGASLETQNLIYRRIYPSVFAFFCLLTGFLFNFKQFKKLYEHIKNDKYLVGKQLVNYDQPKTSTGTASQDG